MKAPLVLSAVLGALLTLGLFDGPLGLVFAYQSAPVAQPPAITIEIDRTLKSDRGASREAPATTVIEKIGGRPAGTHPAAKDRHLAPAKLGDCEPLASPVADPKLATLAGRCFV
jgi:hypothetical protein